ncbi:MAG: excinuclease ABC subunit UvrA [Elusimicrobiota bacterium]|jgi:excinuclease ABC subunit A
MTSESIVIRGARQHNLKNITLKIPRDQLVVITGLSGSGKSSLAFDTIYAEGQRRYVESLSAYARQFLELMEKPDVDLIEGLSPAIAIEQRTPSHNPRSTVGTVTEIYDYLRLLFARIGKPHCPQCGREIKPQSAQQIINEILHFPSGTKIQIMAPLIQGRIGIYQELFNRLRQSGFARVRVNGQVLGLDEDIPLDRYKKHRIDLVVDRLVMAEDVHERLADSIETALRESRGLVLIHSEGKNGGSEQLFSEHHACTSCGTCLPEIEPRMFSFNSPYGACTGCDGLGTKLEVDPDLVVTDESLSIRDGVVTAWSNPVTTRTHRWKRSWAGYYEEILEDVCRRNRIPTERPWKELTRDQQKLILYGGGQYKVHWGKVDQEFEGVIPHLQRRHKESESEFVKEEIFNRFMRRRLCPSCKGARLKPECLAVTIAKRSISEICALSVSRAAEFFSQLSSPAGTGGGSKMMGPRQGHSGVTPLSDKERQIARQILKEVQSRLTFLVNVGLDYVTLDRESATLAGGEAQRIHLATQIGSGLVGVMYVLDEPTIGLHQRDNDRLLQTLFRLRDLGNTLLVVEHDEETIRAADWIVDLGPGAGVHGGHIVAEGSLAKILAEPRSLTGQYLKGQLQVPVPPTRRAPQGRFLEISGAAQFNLKNIDVKIPLGCFVGITGVSGSGKSTFVHEILYKALAQRLYHSKEPPGKFRSLKGSDALDKVIVVDQSPIGRTPRSNPATYTGAYSSIRDLFSMLPEAKRRGYKPGRFSFNVKGGRCENCEGDGTLKISMQFLPDVYVKCEVCQGKRFNEETLQVRYKGKTISEVLEMPVEEGLEFFKNIPSLSRLLGTLNEVGLGYIALGQSSTTLSGGEAQRVKLATELGRRATGRTLYILDEPTTGLHFADVHKLLESLHRLVTAGNTVLIIEHNLDVIKTADWLIDLGPEGGDGGGRIVAEGTPEMVAAAPESHTGRYLKRLFKT